MPIQKNIASSQIVPKSQNLVSKSDQVASSSDTRSHQINESS
nr:MAG TPA: hypothetical protein [Caudoviricetes sp.]